MARSPFTPRRAETGESSAGTPGGTRGTREGDLGLAPVRALREAVPPRQAENRSTHAFLRVLSHCEYAVPAAASAWNPERGSRSGLLSLSPSVQRLRYAPRPPITDLSE
ncbi:MAG: hypothetical protein HYX95_01670 [Chloroflexi bacterium]|nr:hypothetical protein [Chloroflexota bacterium]